VTDAAVMLAALTGPSPRDALSLNAPVPNRLNPGLIGQDLSGVRVGAMLRMANPRVDRDVEANTRASLESLAALGAEVEDVAEQVDWIEFPGRIMYQGNFAVAMEKHRARWENQMDPVLLTFMERGRGFDMQQFRSAQYARTTLFRAVQALFERYDFLVTPTLTRTALPSDFDAAHDEVEIDGEKCGITRQGWTAYVYPFNLTGHPALSIPSGFAADGLPTGLQIVGRWGADLDVLRIGAILEAIRPWADRRPTLLSP
jgi:aspartyl-tRNA(Asn)/glutamyl-tRNA(Gln) amidotransferase subunit A